MGAFRGKITFGIVATLCGFMTWCAPAKAGVVATRADVQQILGLGAMNEDFTEFKAAVNTNYAIDFQTLNSQTIDQNQGPGLVQPDLSFSVNPYPTDDMNWEGPNDVGAPQYLVFLLTTPPATGSISFATPTPAFGVDMNSFFPGTYSVNLFGPSGSLTDTQQVTTSNTGPVFFGYSAAGGISRVDIVSSANDPVAIDNVLYSVPEPATLGVVSAIAGVCLMRRRAHNRDGSEVNFSSGAE